LVPVVLAAWQYGRRGWLSAMAVLAVGQVLLLPLLYLTGEDIGFTGVAMLGRLGMIALLGYIVMRMGTALQAEHHALLRAHQQLAQRAATTTQLAESRERNRLARELHDTLAHALTGLNVQLQAMDTLLDHDPAEVRQQLHAAQQTVRQGIQESRRAIQALRATPLEDLGLAEGLRQLCQQQAERTGIACTCDVTGGATLGPLTEQAVYRIAEAALANVEQHAAASMVTVTLVQSSEPPTLWLQVHDDGVGFERSQVAGDRYGLSVMAERAQLIGATLRIQSAPSQGTTVSLEVP
jgi:signal transduction histidine kinase